MSSFNIVTQKKERRRERERENIKTIPILIAFGLLKVCILYHSNSFDCLMMSVTSYKSFDESINTCIH